MPVVCDCGSSFNVEHALSCPRGAFPTIRHNEIRDITANLLTEVCHNVMIEPDLQPLTGEAMSRLTSNTTDGARLDIAANGFWGGRFERTFLDVRVFNPHAPTNRKYSIANCYRKHEEEKKRTYEQRILKVEHSTFTPVTSSVLSHWGNGQAMLNLLKAAGLSPCRQVATPIQFHLILATMPLVILSAANSDTVYQGCTLVPLHGCKVHPPIDLVNSEALLQPVE